MLVEGRRAPVIDRRPDGRDFDAQAMERRLRRGAQAVMGNRAEYAMIVVVMARHAGRRGRTVLCPIQAEFKARRALAGQITNRGKAEEERLQDERIGRDNADCAPPQQPPSQREISPPNPHGGGAYCQGARHSSA